MPSRDDARLLLGEWVKNPGLLRHCLAVETAMRAYAPKYGGDPETWGIAGLLHDFDYERYPVPDPAAKTGHPFEGVKVLKELGYPDEVIRAILGHAQYSGVPRDTDMAKCLFAVDELCGFLTAMAYVRPERLEGITPEAVKKSLNKKKFAEKVSREDIAQGVAELGLPEEVHFETVIRAMQNGAEALGLAAAPELPS
jgi:putative nucleotidyltransferase with HDIG domain